MFLWCPSSYFLCAEAAPCTIWVWCLLVVCVLCNWVHYTPYTVQCTMLGAPPLGRVRSVLLCPLYSVYCTVHHFGVLPLGRVCAVLLCSLYSVYCTVHHLGALPLGRVCCVTVFTILSILYSAPFWCAASWSCACCVTVFTILYYIDPLHKKEIMLPEVDSMRSKHVVDIF
jgi:hypothetical protein